MEIGSPYITHDKKRELWYYLLRFLTNFSFIFSVVNASSFLWFTGKEAGVFSASWNLPDTSPYLLLFATLDH